MGDRLLGLAAAFVLFDDPRSDSPSSRARSALKSSSVTSFAPSSTMPAPSTHPAIVLNRPSMPPETSVEGAVDWRFLYAGRRAAGKPRLERRSGRRARARHSGPHRAPRVMPVILVIHRRNPLGLPTIFVTASGCGRDDLPETEESLPSHSRSGCPAGRLRAAGQAEAKGRAADEAAARRTMAGLPFSGCESGRLRKAPTVSRRPSGTWETGPGRTPDLRVQDLPGGSGISVSAPPPAEKGLRLLIGRAGPGFGPGAAKPAGPRVSAHGPVRRNRGLRPRIPPAAEPKASAREREGGKRDASSESAKRRTARASALVGEPAGKPERLRPRTDSGGSGGLGPRPRFRYLETAQRGTPRLPGWVLREGTVGAGSNAGPHYLTRPDGIAPSRAARARAIARTDVRRQSSRCRPGSRRPLDLHGGATIVRAGAGEAPQYVLTQHAGASPEAKPARSGAPGLSFIGPGSDGQRRSRHRRPAPCRRPHRRQRPLRASSSRAARA